MTSICKVSALVEEVRHSAFNSAPSGRLTVGTVERYSFHDFFYY
jgi:hypothetical protein